MSSVTCQVPPAAAPDLVYEAWPFKRSVVSLTGLLVAPSRADGSPTPRLFVSVFSEAWPCASLTRQKTRHDPGLSDKEKYSNNFLFRRGTAER